MARTTTISPKAASRAWRGRLRRRWRSTSAAATACPPPRARSRAERIDRWPIYSPFTCRPSVADARADGRSARSSCATGSACAAFLFGPLCPAATGACGWRPLAWVVVAALLGFLARALQPAAPRTVVAAVPPARAADRARGRRAAAAPRSERRGYRVGGPAVAALARRGRAGLLSRRGAARRRAARRRPGQPGAARPDAGEDVIGLFPQRRRPRVSARHRRLRLRQPAFRHQGVRARGARGRARHAVEVTADPDRVRRAERIVLPGVGAFADCRRGLDAVPGMARPHDAKPWSSAGAPFLGICVGMQLMASRGLEHEVTAGPRLDRRRRRGRSSPPIPASRSRIWAGTRSRLGAPIRCSTASRPARTGLHAYFVHSYALDAARRRTTCVAADRLRRPGHGHGRRATTWPARSSIPRRARSSGSR